ncbi:MAG: efflux RND transporter periplasmic adaptor subunit [Firmicutes bacterium]|nr:efflux RND transporter periplasmic adaptor subunit [Bacillota bacterium]
MKSLSDRRLFLLGFILALALSGCTGLIQEADTPLYVLAAEGELMVVDPADLQPVEFELATVGVRDMIQTREIPVTITFPNSYHLHFEAEGHGGHIDWITWYYGRLEGAALRDGQWIDEGDFIAELLYVIPESLEINRDAIFMERQEFETDFILERNRRQVEVEIKRLELDFSPESDWELMALRLREEELAYQRFLRDSAQRREDLADRLERLEEPIKGERLYAPISGVLSWLNPAFNNTVTDLFRARIVPTYGQGRRVATVVDTDAIVFTASAPPYVMRFGEIMSVRPFQGDMYFTMQVVSDPLTRPVTRDGFFDFRLAPLCMDEFFDTLRQHEVTTLELSGIHLRAQPVLPLALDAVVVHNRAITAEGPRNYVLLYEDGAISKRYVLIGATLDNYVQIMAGLEPGQRVVVQ